ncbi:MAG TPA: hypothetical protein VHX15_04860 [Frankiaceae bacterium]|nr:hypothetical protein [Frankiaceae bacterium]
MRSLQALAILVITALLVLATAASGAQALLPPHFWGAVPQGGLTEAQLQRLRHGGVDAIRIPVSWPTVQPSPGGDLQWGGIDAWVEAAARARLEVLPFLYDAPDWAVHSAPVPGTHGAARAPAHLPIRGRAGREWARFVRAAADRYGTRGSFWLENPLLPRMPIHDWQIWNEENFKYFVARPNPGEYGRLVRRSEHALRAGDPRAELLLGGLFARPAEARYRVRPPQAYTAADFLRLMYRRTPGITSRFDGIALHPYAGDHESLRPEIEETRTVLREAGDAGKALWITEMGWSSQHPSRRDAFAKGWRGQARQLRGAFRLLRSNQRRWHLRQVYWFSVTDEADTCNFCGGSGLFGARFHPKPAWHAYVHFTGGRVG